MVKPSSTVSYVDMLKQSNSAHCPTHMRTAASKLLAMYREKWAQDTRAFFLASMFVRLIVWIWGAIEAYDEHFMGLKYAREDIKLNYVVLAATIWWRW